MALVLLTFLAWTPILAPLLAAAVATSFGCPLNEATAHPCLVAGVDIGEALVVMFLMGWLAIFGLPLMLLSAAGWLALWARRRRDSSPS